MGHRGKLEFYTLSRVVLSDSLFQCNACSKANRACFGPTYAGEKWTKTFRLASKRCVRCFVDHNVCTGGEFGYELGFLCNRAPEEEEPSAPGQPKKIIPAKRKASLGNAPTRTKSSRRQASPLRPIESSSQPDLFEALDSFAFQLRQLRLCIDQLEEDFTIIWRDFA